MALPPHIQITPPKGQPLIFTNSSQQSVMNKAGFTTFNILVWFVWLYLLKVLITSLAWLLSIQWTYQQWVDLKHQEELILIFTESAPLGIAFCFIFFLWAQLNIVRFTGKVRRTSKNNSSLKEDCQWVSVEPEEIAQARDAKTVVCHHDDSGKLTAVHSVET